MSHRFDLGPSGDDDVLALLADVSGEDLVSGRDLVGAQLARKQFNLGDLQRLRAAKQAQSLSHEDKMLQLAQAGKIPQIPMGVPATAIATTVTATIVVTPTVPVRITDFFVDSSIAAACAIISMTMARINLLANANPVPCSGFDPTAGAQRSPLEIRKVPAGSPITLLVQNFSLADITFRAWFQVIDLSTQVY